jgi:hypothetical protein
LGQSAGLDMSNFDEARIEKQDVRVMESNPFCSAFPLNCSSRAARVTMFVDVNSEFYMNVLILYLGLMLALNQLTVVTQEEFVI